MKKTIITASEIIRLIVAWKLSEKDYQVILT